MADGADQCIFPAVQQVDCIGDMDQVVDPTDIPMHAIQACDLVGKVGLHEAVPVPRVEFLVAFSAVDKGLSKFLATHFDLRVPLLARCAARACAFIEECVRGPLHRFRGKQRCLAPGVYVDNVAQIENAGVCL